MSDPGDPTTADLFVAAMRDRDSVAARLARTEAMLDRVAAQRDEAMAAARRAAELLSESDARAGALERRADDLEERLQGVMARQQELLSTIRRLTHEVPFPDEIAGWTAQRASLVAEIGTLRARVAELERDRADPGILAVGVQVDRRVAPQSGDRDEIAALEAQRDRDRPSGMVEEAVGASSLIPDPAPDLLACPACGFCDAAGPCARCGALLGVLEAAPRSP